MEVGDAGKVTGEGGDGGGGVDDCWDGWWMEELPQHIADWVDGGIAMCIYCV